MIQESEQVAEEDVSVAGLYSVMVPNRLEFGDQASAALDGFHATVAVSVLEDFSFWVFEPIRPPHLQGQAWGTSAGLHPDADDPTVRVSHHKPAPL